MTEPAPSPSSLSAEEPASSSSNGQMAAARPALGDITNHGPPVWIAGRLVPPNGEEVKAKPSPSPLVTPELGDRLCRMASQHIMSDYNRLKRGVFTPATPSMSASQPLPSQPIYPKHPLRASGSIRSPYRIPASESSTPPSLPTPAASPTPSLTSQLASLVAANGGATPGGLSAPLMSGRSKSAPQTLGGSTSNRGVASTFGGYVAALAGSISNTFAAQGFPSFVSSPSSSPSASPDPTAAANGLNGNSPGRMQGAKRKPRTQTPGDSPAQPSVVLPPVNGTSLGHVFKPRRSLMDEEGHQGVLPPTSGSAVANGVTSKSEDVQMLDVPTSVPMATADSRDSACGTVVTAGDAAVARDANGMGVATPTKPAVNGAGTAIRYTPNGSPILKGTRAPPTLSRSSSLRTPQSALRNGVPPVIAATDPVPSLPQTPAPTISTPGDSPPAVKTSESHPMNISPVLPPELLTAFGELLLADSKPSSPGALVGGNVKVDMHDLTGPNSASAHALLPSPPTPLIDGVVKPDDGRPRLGNMLLSSCPGKKIRLSNNSTPEQRLANGNRSAICRDLGLDFRRAADRGVKAVVCCIDDAELAFLGSPWLDYYTAATEAGLAVLRIPMAEGFAPAEGVEEMERLLEVVVENWTVKGEDVLCHCRGGVGRAGLVACCWLIRCGLVRTALEVQPGTQGPRRISGRVEPPVRTSSMEVNEPRVLDARYLRQVERVIEVIRRRRSVKSIETPLQAAFVLQYLEYTHAKTAASTPATTTRNNK